LSSARSRFGATSGPLLGRERRAVAIQKFVVTIEGPGWDDFENVELPRLPDEGEPIETKYGTCLVTRAEQAPDMEGYAGKIVCRLS
jgi:hypothetical protein